MPVAAPPLWRLRPQPAQSGRGERRGGGQSRAGRRTSSPPGPGRSRLSWVHLFWTLPPKFLSLRFGGPDQCGRGSARMWLAASAERTGGASAVEASGPESVRSSLSWVHFVLDSPSKVLFHPVRVGFSGYGGGFSGERREQTGGLQRLRRRASRVRSSLSWVHLFWTLPPKFFSLRFGGLGQRERGSAERQRRRRANSEASAWLQRLERRRVRSSLSWVHLFWTPPPKFFSIRYGRGQGLRGDLGFSGLWRQVRVCPERSVLGTFVLDSPSKVPFTSVREGGFSGERREQTGGLQRLWRRVLVCAERSVLGTFCSGLSLQSSFLLVLGALASANGVQGV